MAGGLANSRIAGGSKIGDQTNGGGEKQQLQEQIARIPFVSNF
jgi:hypothetical protein